MSSIRLSIIIPVYNVEAYIAQCLDSVYRQDIPEDEYEVICIDDCSPDKSLSIIESYAAKHSNLIIVKNQINRKLGGARNAGTEVASGNYVMFVDSDDFLEENVLEKLCDFAENSKLDILHFDYEVFPEKVNLRKVEDTEIMTGTELFFDNRFIWYHDLVTAWRKIYRRQFLIESKISFAEHIMFEDNDYAFLVFAYAAKVQHKQIDAYHYRNNPESITRIAYSSEHISYWMDLCHRLINVKRRLSQEGKSERFQSELSKFIKYHISHILQEYGKLPENEKKIAQKTILNGCNRSLFPYLSKKKILKIKLGMI